MYIGPWQEYRLAKIQDDAIQRIRQEWEDNIRARLPDGDDTRIRELIQPLMAKLPALLLATKSGERSDTPLSLPGKRKARRPTGTASSRASTRPSTAVSTASSTRSRVDRAETGASRNDQSNQDTHDVEKVGPSQPRPAIARQATMKKPKKKTGATTALEDVERRRKMYAKWMRTQQEQPLGVVDDASETSLASESHATPGSTRLPPIHAESPITQVVSDPQHHAPPTEPTRFPPLHQTPRARDVHHLDPEAPSPRDEPNLDDSLDEDAVNQLLNWTDNLLSPNALEASLAALEDDLDEVG